jgi:hypothetical protein
MSTNRDYPVILPHKSNHMKKIILFVIALTAVACSRSIDNEDLKKLNGYWEIETAVLPDGTKKEYTVNSTIDYFEVKDGKGIRKKVMPQLDGSYRMNDVSEKIATIQEDGNTFISYTTDYAKWKEQVLELDDEHLVVKNPQGLEYHYKKPQPFSVK